MCFLKNVKIQPVEMSIQPIVLHLVDFEKDLKSLTLFDFTVKPIQPVVLRIQPIVFLKTITKLC